MPPRKVVSNNDVVEAPRVILAKSRKRIAVAAEEIRYYAQVGRDITPDTMYWKILTNLNIQWNVLKDLKKQDNPDVKNLTKNDSFIKWIESFRLHLNAIVCVCNYLLVYVVCEQHDLSGVTHSTLLSDKTHSKKDCSVEVETRSLTSHNHPLFISNRLCLQLSVGVCCV